MIASLSFSGPLCWFVNFHKWFLSDITATPLYLRQNVGKLFPHWGEALVKALYSGELAFVRKMPWVYSAWINLSHCQSQEEISETWWVFWRKNSQIWRDHQGQSSWSSSLSSSLLHLQTPKTHRIDLSGAFKFMAPETVFQLADLSSNSLNFRVDSLLCKLSSLMGPRRWFIFSLIIYFWYRYVNLQALYILRMKPKVKIF